MRKLRFRDVEQLVQVTYWLNWKQFCSLSSSLTSQCLTCLSWQGGQASLGHILGAGLSWVLPWQLWYIGLVQQPGSETLTATGEYCEEKF